jgi:dienelactone hydrolase
MDRGIAARRRAILGAAACVALGLATALAAAGPEGKPPRTEKEVFVRGKKQTLRLYGDERDRRAVVASGDGGWIHLAPDVAEWLARQGYFVVGVDSRAYLSSFTSGGKTLTTADVPTDYRSFVDAARAGREQRVLLVGVSLGAGLSVLAASSAELQPALAGVVALGMPNDNELGWRFRDSIIYFTKRVPKEPLFHAEDFIPKLPPVPLASIHSTHDEFVPLDVERRLFAPPGPLKRLWVVEANNHRFSGNTAGFYDALREALGWIAEQRSPEVGRP